MSRLCEKVTVVHEMMTPRSMAMREPM